MRLFRLGLGFALASSLAFSARRQRTLDPSGAQAATAVGTVVFTAGGLQWSWPMITFFLSSSLLTRLGEAHKMQKTGMRTRPGGRNAGQVLANGGIPTAIALARVIGCSERNWFLPYLGSLATAAADTWATELGLLSPTAPRSLLTGRRVPPGTSGAVSPLGLLGSLAGAALVVATVPGLEATTRWSALLAGASGSLLDSLLGATIQARYRCSACNQSLEESVPHCGFPPKRVAGLPGCTNDTVNALATAAGALLAVLFNRVGERRSPLVRTAGPEKLEYPAECSDELLQPGDAGPSRSGCQHHHPQVRQ